MSPGTIALIVVAVSVAAWGLFMANVTIRKTRKQEADSRAPDEAEAQTAGEARATGDTTEEPKVTVEKPPAKKLKPLTTEQLAVTRRQFLNRAWTA